MSRHQQQLTLVHKHQQDLEARLRHMSSVGIVSRPMATQLQEQLDKSSTELELAERHLRDLERHYFAARACVALLGLALLAATVCYVWLWNSIHIAVRDSALCELPRICQRSGAWHHADRQWQQQGQQAFPIINTMLCVC
jgi:hypothetical protein